MRKTACELARSVLSWSDVAAAAAAAVVVVVVGTGKER